MGMVMTMSRSDWEQRGVSCTKWREEEAGFPAMPRPAHHHPSWCPSPRVKEGILGAPEQDMGEVAESFPGHWLLSCLLGRV